MAGRSKQDPTRLRRSRSAPLSSRQLARELLRRREKHERAIAELDALLAVVGGRRSGITLPAASNRAQERTGQRRVRHVPRPPREATTWLDKIVAAVSDAYGVSIAELRAPERGPPRVARPRLVAMFLAYELLSGCSQEQIGNYFGGRGHTAVFHACRAVRKMRHTDPKIDRLVAGLRP